MSPLYVASRKYLVGCSCAPGTTENGPLENCWLGLIRAGPSVCVSNNATIHHTHWVTFYTTGGKNSTQYRVIHLIINKGGLGSTHKTWETSAVQKKA